MRAACLARAAVKGLIGTARTFPAAAPAPLVRSPIPRSIAQTRTMPPGVKRARVEARAADAVVPAIVPGSHRVGGEHKMKGFSMRNHTFTVPIDYEDPAKGTVDVFVRELYQSSGAAAPDLPYLVYLQGGPGFECPRFTEPAAWAKAALSSFRVLLLDQRGTGLSSKITPGVVARLPGSAADKAAHLGHFRADSIVRDCEAIRKALGATQGTLLGQSFGGFCAVLYLSRCPDSLREVLITGGLPPSLEPGPVAETAYRALFTRVRAQNEKLYRRFPELKGVVREVVRAIEAAGGAVETPAGNRLTPTLLQGLGLGGLGSVGGFEKLYFLFEGAFESPGILSIDFLKAVDASIPFDSNCLYALLHEACYASGPGALAWAAQRVRDEEPNRTDFDAVAAAKSSDDRPVLFTGEMVFPSTFQDVAALRPIADVAEAIAQQPSWPVLYDPTALAANKVPCAATAYFDDMYVDFDLAKRTGAGIQGLRVWVTSELMHGGIRDDGQRVFERLLGMARDTVPLF